MTLCVVAPRALCAETPWTGRRRGAPPEPPVPSVQRHVAPSSAPCEATTTSNQNKHELCRERHLQKHSITLFYWKTNLRWKWSYRKYYASHSYSFCFQVRHYEDISELPRKFVYLTITYFALVPTLYVWWNESFSMTESKFKADILDHRCWNRKFRNWTRWQFTYIINKCDYFGT